MIQALLLQEIINEIKGDTLVNKPVVKVKTKATSYYLSNEKDKVVYTAPALGLTTKDITMSIKNKHLRVKSKDVKLTSNFQNAIDQ